MAQAWRSARVDGGGANTWGQPCPFDGDIDLADVTALAAQHSPACAQETT
jgi:hypothetical protein